MAKRSDFAQKLLDDLRLRKERMGMTTSGQHYSAQVPSTGDAHGHSRRAFRGSAEATSSRPSNKNIPNTEVTKVWLNTRHHRAPTFEGTSHDVVPVGRTRSREQGIDVSMALALALSNTGKLQNLEFFSNASVGNKRFMHRGSLNFREMDANTLRTSDQVPILSPSQIGEISNGVQQLNMILSACSNSNGIIINRDAIDIGRELLKGAMDLEESLRMLVSLQDASDYMATSKGKQIKLLKGKEDESSSEEVNNRKLMRPRFSFDRPTKQTHNHVRDGSSCNPIEYKQVAPMLNPNKISSNSSLQFNYHRWSPSTDLSSKPDAQFVGHGDKYSHRKEIRNFSKTVDCPVSTNIKHSDSTDGSVRDKVRISNVVAKLMGLEELPLAMPEMKKIEVQNDPNPKQAKGSGKMKIDEEANQKTHSAHKMKGKNMVTREKGIVQTKADINLGSINGKIKKNMKELNSPPPYSKMLHFSVGKPMEEDRMDQHKEFKVANKEAAEIWEKVPTMQQTCAKKVAQGLDAKKTSEYITSDDTVRKHDKAKINKDAIPKQQQNAEAANPIVPQQHPKIDRWKTKHTIQKNWENIEKNKRTNTQPIMARKKEVITKNEELSSGEMKTQKVSSCTSTTTVTGSLFNNSDKVQPNEYQKFEHHNEQNKLQKRNSAYHEVEKKLENEHSEERRPLKAVANTEKEVMPLISAPAIRKPIPNPPTQKVRVRQLMQGKNDNKRISTEERRKTKTTKANVQTMKEKKSFLHELEHGWKERTGKAEMIVASHEVKLEHHSEEITAPPNFLYSSDESEIPRLQDNIMTEEINVKAQQEEAAILSQSNNATITGFTVLSPLEVSVKEDLDLLPLADENKSEPPADRRQLRNSNYVGGSGIETPKVQGQGLLTEDECTLKQILMNSQHFLNTAQALFRIKIPIGDLQAIENLCEDGVNNLIQDTGYEVMRRKGKREEAIFLNKMSFAPAKVRRLDDLIKELSEDLNSLEFSSETECTDIAECLHKQIEIDIENKNPDVNCMWDICWNSMAFANIEKEEIIRDVEKHVLNVLINDLARDLMIVRTHV